MMSMPMCMPPVSSPNNVNIGGDVSSSIGSSSQGPLAPPPDLISTHVPHAREPQALSNTLVELTVTDNWTDGD